eukprot:2323198-Pleurochrysis_carterae.AAC.1
MLRREGVYACEGMEKGGWFGTSEMGMRGLDLGTSWTPRDGFGNKVGTMGWIWEQGGHHGMDLGT